MLVIIDGMPVNKKTANKMKRLVKRKTAKRQDTIDDEGMNIGPNRGNEATFYEK